VDKYGTNAKIQYNIILAHKWSTENTVVSVDINYIQVVRVLLYGCNGDVGAHTIVDAASAANIAQLQCNLFC
jgi:hypothetical protein